MEDALTAVNQTDPGIFDVHSGSDGKSMEGTLILGVVTDGDGAQVVPLIMLQADFDSILRHEARGALGPFDETEHQG